MDQGSSPNLPVGSLATNKFHNGSESLLIGKKLQSFDDSSSVTSMSTNSKSTLCMACKEEESSVKRLVTCIKCKRKIHGGCANPYVEDYKAPYTCTRCKKKDQAQTAKKKLGSAFGDSQNSTKFSNYTSPYAPSLPAYPSSVTSEPAKDSPKISGMKPGIQCTVPGCTNIFFSIHSGSPALCTKHRIEQQNALAKAAAPKPAAPVSRPFQKEKLYTMKPEDKQLAKRKRQTTKRSSNGSLQDMDQEPYTMFMFQPSRKSPNAAFKTPELIRKPSTPTRPSPRSALRKTLEQKEKQASITKSPEEVEKAVDDLNRSLDSASMAESPIEPTSSFIERLFSRHISARATPNVASHESPDYSPPPPLAVDDENPWTGIIDRADSPGSQIAQELAATASQKDGSEHNSSLDYGRSGLPSIDEEIATSHAHRYKPPQVRDQEDEDEEMLDPDSRALIDRLASKHPSSPAKSASPPAVRPLSSPSSSAYSANVSSQIEEQGSPSDTPPAAALGARHELLIDTTDEAPQPNSIEAIRAQRAANFDTTELDSFLFKQAQPESDEQPTSKELLNTQVWGHIDPRVAWPKKMTPEQIQEKIKEIEARGGKKANFGKILTAQVRKERADKGWNIHQTSERRSEEECKEMDRRLEELFGTEGLGNCVPGIRDGRLVMIEQLEPEEPQTGPGRRKKRREAKTYPVMGGQ